MQEDATASSLERSLLSAPWSTRTSLMQPSKSKTHSRKLQHCNVGITCREGSAKTSEPLMTGHTHHLCLLGDAEGGNSAARMKASYRRARASRLPMFVKDVLGGQCCRCTKLPNIGSTIPTLHFRHYRDKHGDTIMEFCAAQSALCNAYNVVNPNVLKVE